jgi:hypothetical protein
MFHRCLWSVAIARTTFNHASRRVLWASLLALGASPALAGVGASPPSDAAVLAALPSLRQSLDDTLVDYPGTRFRYVRAFQNEKGDVVLCGDMNAPNRTGGDVRVVRLRLRPQGKPEPPYVAGQAQRE